MDTADALRPSRPPRPTLSKPFETQWTDGTLTLVVASDLNERSWAAWFGGLQASLDERQWQGQDIHTCVIDLRPCRWADPLPLLSLALSLANFEAKGGEVRLFLPEACPKPGEIRPADSGQDGLQRDCLERGRLLKFLAREGFLDLLTRVQPMTRLDGASQLSQQARQTWIGTQPLAIERVSELRELRAPLAFEESTCVPAVLLALGMEPSASVPATLEGIDRWVRRTIQTRIHPVVMDKVPAWAHGGLLCRLQNHGQGKHPGGLGRDVAIGNWADVGGFLHVAGVRMFIQGHGHERRVERLGWDGAPAVVWGTARGRPTGSGRIPTRHGAHLPSGVAAAPERCRAWLQSDYAGTS
jgi:hypothetical protein